MDGSGKSYQANRLQQYAQRAGLTAATGHFPVYNSPTGVIISAFLKGLLPLSPEDAQIWYANNRRENLPQLQQLLRENDIVILDRYYPSGWAYGMAQGLHISWLESLDTEVPRPDAIFILDLPAEATRARRKSRDIFEADMSFLNTVRANYLTLAQRYGWAVVNARATKEEVTAQLLSVMRTVWEVGATEYPGVIGKAVC